MQMSALQRSLGFRLQTSTQAPIQHHIRYVPVQNIFAKKKRQAVFSGSTKQVIEVPEHLFRGQLDIFLGISLTLLGQDVEVGVPLTDRFP